MVQFNTKDNEILVKLVYYGPGLSGKTTNLQKLHEMMDPTQKTDLFSVNTMEDRTLFFDLLPVDLGYVYGNSIKLQIYTVPGQVHYDSTRRIVLSGADGVIFVADSEKSKLHENVQSINNLYHNLQANRLNIKEVPMVIQYNKRDLPDVLAVDVLNQKLNFRQVPYLEGVAIKGEGVLETFIEGVKQTVRHIFQKYQLSKNIKNVEEVVQKLEKTILAFSAVSKEAQPSPVEDDATDQTFNPKVGRGGRTVLKYTHTIEDDDRSSQDKLLQKALTSNMETARLYSDLKISQTALIKKNEELAILYKQLEKTNNENIKIRTFLENLVNFAGEAIVTFNDLWVIQNWNQAAEEMFHYTKKEILNQNINILFPGSQMANMNKVLSFVVNGKAVKGFETRLLTKGKDEISVNITFSPIKNQNNTIVAFTALIRDLSFMQNVKKKIFDLQRFESAAMLLPDVMNDLRLSWQPKKPDQIEEIFGPPKKKPKKDKHQEEIMTTIESLVAEQPEDNSVPVAINDLVQHIHKALEKRMKRQSVKWSAQLNPQVPPLERPQQPILHALLNLVLNALDALKDQDDAKLTVGTHHANGEVLLQIIDNGAGVPMEDLDRMFLSMADQKDDLRNIRFNASRQIIRQNGGAIRIDAAPGRGTKVTVKFKSAG